jgi:glycogen operon protein
MHVDGFRFDLASTLAREFYDVDKLSSFFELIQQDPVVSQVKLIAEPWDVGPGGYQVGNFPPQWTEWNGKYRDTVRDFWRGEPKTLGEFASRITGSADLYEHSGRRPVASINFVTAHDGFTLADLVSYNQKHNEANGEGNRDGESHNRSWNCGAEGPSEDPKVLGLRARQQRNFIASLLLSQGVPMILHGDELGRTQQGNNNGYCQDSELTWINWDSVDQPLIEFTAAVNALRTKHPTFRRSRFFDGRPVRRGEGERLPDIVWLDADATTMKPEDWDSAFGRSVGVFLNGDGIRARDDRGRRITDVNFLLYFNAHDDEVGFTLPSDEYAPAWDIIIDTAGHSADTNPVKAGDTLAVAAKSLVVLRAHSTPEVEPDHSVAASLAALSQTATSETATLTTPTVPAPKTTKQPAPTTSTAPYREIAAGVAGRPTEEKPEAAPGESGVAGFVEPSAVDGPRAGAAAAEPARGEAADVEPERGEAPSEAADVETPPASPPGSGQSRPKAQGKAKRVGQKDES